MSVPVSSAKRNRSSPLSSSISTIRTGASSTRRSKVSRTLPSTVPRCPTIRLPIANVVDTNYSAVTKVPKKYLPAADAYGGMHRHLRAQAATL